MKDIHHIAIRTAPENFERSEKFYTELLGMKHAHRPDLGFPGAWLDFDQTMIHLVAEEWQEQNDPWYARPEAKSAIDHIAIKAQGFDTYKKRAIDLNMDWRQTYLPDAGLWQLFVLDPNGVIVELNFKISDEPAGSVGPTAEKRYPPIKAPVS